MIKIEREWESEKKAASERERKREIRGETEKRDEQGHMKESRKKYWFKTAKLSIEIICISCSISYIMLSYSS